MAYERLMQSGVKELHYVSGMNLLGDDELATVDGVHPTDLGFVRIADVISDALEGVLELR